MWRADYNPFGDTYSIGGLATNNLRFPGQYFLIEDGLHYNWYRDYDPSIGRYTQPDPLGFIDGPSLYAYARSAPMTYVDPQGLQIVIPMPRPGFTPVPPGVFDEWRKNAEAGIKGLWNFCRKAIGSGGGSGDDHERCLRAASGSTGDWERFCRSISDGMMSNTVGGETAKRACWSKTYESERNKKNWCDNLFGKF